MEGGGKFQGAQKASFTDAVTLYTISGTPATEQLTPVTVDIPEYFRYLRYISPNGGYCNVAEVEFYGRFKSADTGVDTITLSPQKKDDFIYDLQGRRVLPSNLKSGVYIRNGRKIIIH